MANFQTKTLKEIHDSFMARYAVLRNKYGDKHPLLEKSFIKSIGYAISGVAVILWQLAVWIYKQCFPQTCDLPMLKFWGNLVGVEYQEGQAANLTILLEGVTAPYLISGTVYKDLESGLIFKTVSQVSNENGQITATVQCSSTGTVGNLSIETVLNIANPLDGIPSTATVQGIKIEGSEDEEVEEYRKRVLYRYRNKTQIGSMIDYYNWALEVPGIVDVLPYVFEEGTTTLYLIASGSGRYRSPSGSLEPNPFPKWENGQFTELTGEGQFLQVAKAIEGTEEGVHDRRPVQAKVELKEAIYTPIKIEITGLSDTSFSEQIRTTLINELDQKRPHIVVLGYSETNAKINSVQLSGIISQVIGEATIQKFTVKKGNDEEISELVLENGSLFYLSELTINSEIIYRG